MCVFENKARENAKLLTYIVMSNLSYCPLIWMFCSKSAINEIKRTNRRALRALYEDYDSSFEQLPDKDGSVTVHQILSLLRFFQSPTILTPLLLGTKEYSRTKGIIIGHDR